MKVIDHYGCLEADRGAVIALGNFDGLHRGHKVVINTAADIAKANNAILAVACFRPHPSQFFDPNVTPFRLMSARVRARLLKEMGAKTLYEIPFDKTLTQMDDEEFIFGFLQSPA